MVKNEFFAFYGSLREGMDFYNDFVGRMIKLQTVDLKGYRMYSLGEYPYAVPTSDQSRHIKVDLFHVFDPYAASEIHAAEIGSGYYFDEIEYDGRKYGIYLFKQAHQNDIEIVDGDWVRYVKKIGF